MNASDRPVQVGSHFHFFEVNRALQFDREVGFGMRRNIPAGTAVRFEPGDTLKEPAAGMVSASFALALYRNQPDRSPLDVAKHHSQPCGAPIGTGQNALGRSARNLCCIGDLFPSTSST